MVVTAATPGIARNRSRSSRIVARTSKLEVKPRLLIENDAPLSPISAVQFTERSMPRVSRRPEFRYGASVDDRSPLFGSRVISWQYSFVIEYVGCTLMVNAWRTHRL